MKLDVAINMIVLSWILQVMVKVQVVKFGHLKKIYMNIGKR